MKRKTILLFVFENFADWEVSLALKSIRKTNRFDIKTIAIRKEPLCSDSGLLILPDFDFMPEVDLNDIDQSNIAMLILPGGSLLMENDAGKLDLLVRHCIRQEIPVVASAGVLPCLLSDHTLITPFNVNAVAFSKIVFAALGIAGDTFRSPCEGIVDPALPGLIMRG